MTQQVAHYDSIGDLYRQYKATAPLVTPEQHLFTTLLGDVTDASVLDLACGHGAYTRAARAHGASRAVGVDVSPEMIRLAQDQTSPSENAVAFHVADVAALPDLGSFDAVTAVWLFNYADSHEELTAMMSSAYRSLRPGGRLIAITINPDFDPDGPDWATYGFTVHTSTPHQGRGTLRAALLMPGHSLPIDVSQWDAESYRQAAHNAGFEPGTWTLATVPDTALQEKGDEYWQAARDNPLIAGYSATRPH
jgi:SAM-dependent methyltransferase